MNKYDETAVRRVQYIITSIVYVDNGSNFEAFSSSFFNKCNSMLLEKNRSNGKRNKNPIEIQLKEIDSREHDALFLV